MDDIATFSEGARQSLNLSGTALWIGSEERMSTELTPIIQSAVVAGALQIFLLLYDV
jgi:hypothetical protein